MRLSELSRLLRDGFSWALAADFTDARRRRGSGMSRRPSSEPRLGERQAEPGAHLEQPLDIARAAARLQAELAQQDPDLSVADFLMSRPEHRRIVRRVQA
jgi:hypothetical protein